MSHPPLFMTLSPLSPPATRLRALLVQPDPALRQSLALALRQRGLEVAECAHLAQARALYAGQGLIVASLRAESTALPAFTTWLRAAAGPLQPWIIALDASPDLTAEANAAQFGVNDLFPETAPPELLLHRLDELQLDRPGRPAGPPSYRARPAAPPQDPSTALLLEHFPAAVAILDRSLRYLAVNARWIREFQIPPTPLIGRSHSDIFPDLHPDWRRLYERCLASGEPHTLHDTLARPDGTPSVVRWEIQPWRETSGAVGGLLLTCSAAPAPQKNPDPLPKTDDSFREMAEAAPFGMILLDDEAHVLYANPQHRAVLGFAAETDEPIQSWLERACAGDEVFQKRALDEWWESVWRRRTSLTCSLRNAEGLVKEIEFRPAALSGHRLLLTVFDVTDARLDEQAIRTSEARYRGLFQQASAPLLMINPSGNVTEVNPAFEALTGLTRHEARRAALTDFLPPETVDRLRAASLAEGSAQSFPSSLRHRSGSQTPVHLSAAVIRNDQGQPAFTACLLAPQPAAAPPSDAPAAPPWAEIAPDWLFLLDADGTILEHSTSRDFAPPSGGPAPVLRGQLLDAALPLLAAPLPLDVMVERLLDNPGHETRCEYTLTANGETAPRTLEARLVLLPNGPPSRFGLALRDLSRARAHARPSGMGAALLQHLLTPALLIDERGRIRHLNPAAEALSGYATAELADAPLSRLLRPEAPEAFGAELARQLQTHRSWHTQCPLTSKDGRPTIGQLDLTPVFDEASSARGFLLLFRPVEATPPPAPPLPSISLHRARNDFQVLSSLLSLQAEDAHLPQVRAALIESRQRLAAVALVYRLIAHEHDTVDFARFTSEIGRTLLEAQRRPAGNITLQPQFSDLILPQRLAIGLGLIFEELIAASLAHAFPDPAATGQLRVTFSSHGPTATLTLHDDGLPLTPALRALREASFSHRLVKLLARQIGGTLTLLSESENQACLLFPLDPPAES